MTTWRSPDRSYRRGVIAPAGYSGTPLPKKLAIKEGHVLALIEAPPEAAGLIAPLPDGVDVRHDLRRRPDVVVAFFVQRSRLQRRLAGLARSIYPAGGLWIAWPKRASGVATDITEDVVRELGLAGGLVDNKVCAISEIWSGLRLVYRLIDR